jgi:hypothetical protein
MMTGAEAFARAAAYGGLRAKAEKISSDLEAGRITPAEASDLRQIAHEIYRASIRTMGTVYTAGGAL